jgi:hypothetical protein
MQGEYQADHLLFDQLEVVYRQFLSLIESSESQPGIGKHQSKMQRKNDTLMQLHLQQEISRTFRCAS